MARLDFDAIRQACRIPVVLQAAGKPVGKPEPCGDLRGPCPIHTSGRGRSRSFAIAPDGATFYCHKCKIKGDAIDLWRELHPGLDAWHAARDLAERILGRVPLLPAAERSRGTVEERSTSERSTIPSSGPQPSQAVPDHHDLRQE